MKLLLDENLSRRIVPFKETTYSATTSATTNRSLIFFGLCLSAAFLFPYHVYPFPSFYNDVLALLGLVIVVIYAGLNKNLVVNIPWIVVVPIGLIACIALQVKLGMLIVPADAILPIAYLCITAIAFIVGASTAAQERGAIRLCFTLAYAFIFAGLLSAIIATLQLLAAEIPFAPYMMLMAHPEGLPVRPFANIGQPNQLALLLCMAIAAIWWLFQMARLRTSFALAASVFLLWAIALTQSRIGWLIIPIMAVMCWYWRDKLGFRRISRWALAGLVLSYFFLVLILPKISTFLGAETVERGLHTYSSSERVVLFQQAWDMSVAHPWFGVGWFQFGPQQLAIATHYKPSAYADHSHNILLNFAANWAGRLPCLFLVY